jgi:hypothetical protein
MENTGNYKIRILAIGNIEFINSLNSIFLSKVIDHYGIETISDEKMALKRLNHNSYDILLLEDNFSKFNTIRLSTMAYAMSRPTIIICNSYFKQLYYTIFWKYFSKFCRRFKTSRKLIFFTKNNSKHAEMVEHLAKNHLQYFQQINDEITKKAKI